MRLIWALDHRLRVESKRLKVRRHLAYSQQLVLRIVGRFPSMSPGQLARILHVDPSSVSATLRYLTRRGLIQRSPDPRDGRRVQLGLTEKGRAVDVPMADSIEAVVSRTMRRMPEGRVVAAREVLDALVVALGTSHGE
jgi:DNA-binding MarR family transcriptional regulator